MRKYGGVGGMRKELAGEVVKECVVVDEGR